MMASLPERWNLAGRVAVVTGAARGIGGETVRLLGLEAGITRRAMTAALGLGAKGVRVDAVAPVGFARA